MFWAFQIDFYWKIFIYLSISSKLNGIQCLQSASIFYSRRFWELKLITNKLKIFKTISMIYKLRLKIMLTTILWS